MLSITYSYTLSIVWPKYIMNDMSFRMYCVYLLSWVGKKDELFGFMTHNLKVFLTQPYVSGDILSLIRRYREQQVNFVYLFQVLRDCFRIRTKNYLRHRVFILSFYWWSYIWIKMKKSFQFFFYHSLVNLLGYSWNFSFFYEPRRLYIIFTRVLLLSSIPPTRRV